MESYQKKSPRAEKTQFIHWSSPSTSVDFQTKCFILGHPNYIIDIMSIYLEIFKEVKMWIAASFIQDHVGS